MGSFTSGLSEAMQSCRALDESTVLQTPTEKLYCLLTTPVSDLLEVYPALM